MDGAGKVDGSVVVALPIDRWSAPESENTFEGGGLTFWYGRNEIHYDTRSGDLALIDRYVLCKTPRMVCAGLGVIGASVDAAVFKG